MTRTLALTVASALALASTPVAAESLFRSEVVRYGDLDLESPQGADALIRRIENAAENVCDSDQVHRPTDTLANSQACAAETTDEAISDTNHPTVIARYHGYTPEIVIDDDYPDGYKK